MNTEKIRDLAQLMSLHCLTKIEIKDGDTEILLEAKRPEAQAPAVQYVHGAESVVQTPAPAPKMEAAEIKADLSGIHVQKSPLVGTLYLAPSADSPAYVKVGDRVKKGEPVCIVESMKVLNELLAEVDGVIAEVCAGNEQVVEFGQHLFMIKTV